MTLNYKNIVVAIDGSEASKKAFQKSLNIAKNNQSLLIITHIIDSRTFGTTGTYDQTFIERAETDAKELVNHYVEIAKLAGITQFKTCIKYGSPKAMIAKEIAPNFSADLIICGATGLNAVERFLIGSVSESITRNALCDVLVVR